MKLVESLSQNHLVFLRICSSNIELETRLFQMREVITNGELKHTRERCYKEILPRLVKEIRNWCGKSDVDFSALFSTRLARWPVSIAIAGLVLIAASAIALLSVVCTRVLCIDSTYKY